jgi:hypothetical protein
MPKIGSVADAFRGSRAAEPVCGKLRAVFSGVSDEPMPDDLTNLANLLEAAFERGDLFAGKTKRPAR